METLGGMSLGIVLRVHGSYFSCYVNVQIVSTFSNPNTIRIINVSTSANPNPIHLLFVLGNQHEYDLFNLII